MLDSLFGGLCLFVFFLFLFALFGHVLWVAGQWVIYALFSSRPAAESSNRQRCPRCDRLVSRQFPDCTNCGLQWNGATARELFDLVTMERQLNRFRRDNVLPQDVAHQLQTQINERRHTLRHPGTPPAQATPDIPLHEPVVEPSAIAAVPELVTVAAPVLATETSERTVPAPASTPPRRSFSDVLAAFMEERNILWGELVGGLLIVGCSIALVISLWQTLQENPLYQYGIFVAVTSGLFGAGLYTLRHWKLEATSRGLLIIATLLVPLNLLALTTAQAGGPVNLPVIVAEGLGLAVFGVLLAMAGRVLAPEARWAYVIGNLGISASQLLVPRLIHSPEVTDSLRILLAGGVPILLQFLTTGVVLVKTERQARLTATQAAMLLRVLGMSTFALAVTLGLVVFWNVYLGFDLTDTLARVAILATLLFLPLAVGGATVHQHLTGDTAAGGWRTLGTAVGLTGMAGMLIALALAWPTPIPVVLVGTVNFAALTAIALRYQLPIIHAGALLSLSAGYLTLWHRIKGILREDQSLAFVMLFSAESAWALLWLIAGVTVAAEVCYRTGRTRHGFAYSIAAGLLIAISLIGITFPALGGLHLDDPLPPMLLYAVYGAGALLCNLRWQRPFVMAFGQSALTVAVIYGGTVWLNRQTWFINYPSGHPARLFDPRSLQAFGIGLGILSLMWAVVRRTGVLEFIQPGRLTVDRAVFVFVVVAQLLVLVMAVDPYVGSELTGIVGQTLWSESVLPHAFGPGAWAMLGVMTIALVVALRENESLALVGLVTAAVAVAILVAGSFAPHQTVVPTLRWGLAAMFALVSALLWWRDPSGISKLARGVALAILALPTIALTVIDAGRLVSPAIPTAMPFSTQMPWFVAVNAPLLLVAFVLAVRALQERAAPYLFAASLTFHLVASLTVWRAYAAGGAEWWVSLLQANVIVAAVMVCLWLGLRKCLAPPEFIGVPGSPLLTANAVVVMGGTGILLGMPVVLLLLNPAEEFTPMVVAVGGLWGWVAFVLALFASVWFSGVVVRRVGFHVLVLSAFALGFGVLYVCDPFLPSIFAAFGDPWPRYHALTFMWFLMLWCMYSTGWEIWGAEMFGTHAKQPWPQQPGYATLRRFLFAIAFLVVAWAIWGTASGDPTGPYLPAATVVAVAVTLGCIAFWSRQPLEVYASGLLLNVAGGILTTSDMVQTDGDVFAIHACCLAVASISWSVVEMMLRRLAPQRSLRGTWPPFPSFAAAGALGVLGMCVITGAVRSVQGVPPSDRMLPLWIALAGAGVAVALRAWDATSTFAPRGFYAVGLIALGFWLHGQRLSPESYVWTATLSLGFYVLAAALIASGIIRGQNLFRVLHVPERIAGWDGEWFVRAQGIVAGIVCAVSVPIALHSIEGQPAYGGAAALALLLPAGVLLARDWPQHSTWLREAVLTIAAFVVAEAGWAMLPHHGRDVRVLWLHDSVILMTALAGMGILYGLGLRPLLRNVGGWDETARRHAHALAAGAAVMLGLVLIQEMFVYDGHIALANLLNRMLRLSASEVAVAPAVLPGQPMEMWAIYLVVAVFGMLMAAGLNFAVTPGRDPLGLSLRGRTAYIYAVEVLFVLLFVHLRITIPGLFRNSFFVQYWPFIVMAIAFAGVGLSEYFYRRDIPVLAKPLVRTGVFLPMLPVLTFWVMPDNRYAVLWFLTGLLYGLLSITKRSFLFALLAATSANIGLWVLLHYGHIPFYQHPQLWLIPPALIALVAEHLNRDRLTPQQSGAIRYIALITIYVSSTADMFIAGLGKSVVMPLVLTVLCIIGVLAGMLLRVRAFLFLGVAFLFVVIGSMIWHAGVDRQQTWILWSSGIVLGVAILALFGVFEKRRSEVLTLVEELRTWQ